MHIDRAHADRYLAFLGFALNFLFLLVIVAFAFTVTCDTTDAPVRRSNSREVSAQPSVFPTARPIFRDAADRKAQTLTPSLRPCSIGDDLAGHGINGSAEKIGGVLLDPGGQKTETAESTVSYPPPV